eukprot:GFYU01003277.1.p1 GENE.GFYU01003277.1~~GFYU01003277.1.p1  ORF type:complete len:518 (+),score=83.79 GFYU01003277.1:179-1732(+)
MVFVERDEVQQVTARARCLDFAARASHEYFSGITFSPEAREAAARISFPADTSPDAKKDKPENKAEAGAEAEAATNVRPIGPSEHALAQLSAFDEPLPQVSQDPVETVRKLHQYASPATIASASSRYFGFVTGGTLPAALGAAWLLNSWDQNVALAAMSPVGSKLHGVAQEWLLEALGLQTTANGGHHGVVFTTGATMASATVLAAARDQQLAKVGWSVKDDGLIGAPPLQIVIGEKCHSTLAKSLGLIGLGRRHKGIHVVPADEQGRMRTDLLPDLPPGPTIVCCQAGEVNTGAFDDFEQVLKWAKNDTRDAWVHVDGAFGLWALVDPERAHLTAGLRDVDSMITDGHKWLNVSYDCGIAIVKEKTHLSDSFSTVAGYLPPSDDNVHDSMHYTPQSSQRARCVEVWAALRSLGKDGLLDLVQENCRLASVMATEVTKMGMVVLNDVVLNQVMVRVPPHSEWTTDAFISAVQSEGTCWCGPTKWNGQTAMRISVSGWNTTENDIRQCCDAFHRILTR